MTGRPAKRQTRAFVTIDPRASESLQSQICAAFSRAIDDGALQPGDRIPSSRELASDLRVSRTTAIAAIEALVAEGWLIARRRSGIFVTSDNIGGPRTAARVTGDVPARSGVEPGRARSAPADVNQVRALSSRGVALAAVPPAAHRISGPPRAFRLGVPALDLFPLRLWNRLTSQRLRSVTRAQLDYGSAAGQQQLREAVAMHVRSARGAQASADSVLITAGAQRGLHLLAEALLDDGDVVAVEDPGYPGARSAFVGAGACLVPIPVDAEGIDIDVLMRMSPAPTMVYTTPSHQFPTGVTMSLARRQALLEWASATNAWVVEDDYDSEFRYGTAPVPCLQGMDRNGRVLYVGSFSKSLYPSLRLGFLVVPRSVHTAFVAIRRASDVHPPTLDQLVVADLIEQGHFERHIRRMRTAYRERLDRLVDRASRDRSKTLRVESVLTGLHTIARTSSDRRARAIAAAAAAHGIEVMPLSAYMLRPGAVARELPAGLVLGFGGVRPDVVAQATDELVAIASNEAKLARSRRT